MSRVANTVHSPGTAGRQPLRSALLMTAWTLAMILPVLSGGCGCSPTSSRRASSPAVPLGTFHGPVYTESAESNLVVSGKAVALQWRPAVRITQGTISFGRVYVGLNADVNPRALQDAMNASGAGVPPIRIPQVGYVEYSTVHEYGVLERAGDVVTLQVKLANGFPKRLPVEVKGRDVIIEGIHYTPAQVR